MARGDEVAPELCDQALKTLAFISFMA